MIAKDTGFRPESTLYRPPDHFLRGSLGRFATGVAVVTFDAPTKRHGLTVNSFTSVSMKPPLVLVSIQSNVHAHDLLRGVPFTINILGAEQRDLAMHFAGKPNLEPQWIEGQHAPRLAGVLSWFECTPWAEHTAGDHTLFIGEVQEFDYRAGDALGFHNGQFTIMHESTPGYEALL